LEPKLLPEAHGKRIVLVDDVMTTGASLQAAALTLRRAGAAHITTLVFARTE
jgi:predicted amidophosphoribosyltransferase